MNAILKPEPETIFDYGLSDEERQIVAYGLSKDDYLQHSSEDGINMGLASLFAMRGDKQKSALYLERINPDFVKTHINWDLIREAA